jgi:alpha-tubulin suppressor-like RCC1 family protein
MYIYQTNTHTHTYYVFQKKVTSLQRVYKKYHLSGYISQVFAGRDHSAALTDSGRVITWGAGAYGQLGNGFGFDSELPSLIESVYNIVQVCNHSLSLYHSFFFSHPIMFHVCFF